MHIVGLLVGFFAAPLALLLLGHRFRARSHRARRMFWGGVTGYVIGVVVAIAAMMLPAVYWGGGNVESGSLRTWVVHWSMSIGLLGGVIAGRVRRVGPHRLERRHKKGQAA